MPDRCYNGPEIGRIPDFGTNAKQFLAMGETANKAIDALKKLPHCVVGNCGGNQVMTFGGSHPEKEKELDFAEQAQDVRNSNFRTMYIISCFTVANQS